MKIEIYRTVYDSEGITGDLYIDGTFYCNTLEYPQSGPEQLMPFGQYEGKFSPDRDRLLTFEHQRRTYEFRAGSIIIPKHDNVVLLGERIQSHSYLKNSMLTVRRFNSKIRDAGYASIAFADAPFIHRSKRVRSPENALLSGGPED